MIKRTKRTCKTLSETGGFSNGKTNTKRGGLMQDGWIKLHRKVLNNEVFRHDRTAWYVFETLLLIVNKKTGSWSGGRFVLADICEMNPNTLYSALKRLEKAKMATLSSNNRYTRIHICNWHKFQGNGNTSGNNRATTEQQLSNTITRIKNKELRNNKGKSPERLAHVKEIYDFYIEQFEHNPNLYKLTDKRKAKIRSRLQDAGREMLLEAVKRTAASSFHRGDNQRGWKADLDFIIKSYEQVERLSQHESKSADGELSQHIKERELREMGFYNE